MVVTLGRQYNVGEKPTVILLYTYINRHAGTLYINRNDVVHSQEGMIVIVYDNRAISPYKNRGLGQQYNVGDQTW